MKKALLALFVIFAVLSSFTFIQYHKFSAVSKGSKIPEYKKLNKALLVIDIQKDLTEKNGKAVLNPELTDRVIENTNKIIENSKKLNLQVVYIRQEFKKGFITDIVTKGAFAQGSSGAQIDPRLKIVSHNIFVKNVMDSFSNAEFEDFLKKNEISDIYITGLDARACIDRTMKAALNRNYKVLVIKDCIGSKTNEIVTEKLAQFNKLGAEIVVSGDIINNLFYDNTESKNSYYQ